MREKARAFFLFFLGILALLSLSPAFSAAEKLYGVSVTLKFSTSNLSINSARIFEEEVSGDSEGVGFFSPEGRNTSTKVSIFSQGTELSRVFLDFSKRTPNGFKSTVLLEVPRNYYGKEIFILVTRDNSITDSGTLVYCGDSSCAGKETVFSCPKDCSGLLKLSTQEKDTKGLSMILGGVFLFAMALVLLFVARKIGKN